MKQITTDIGSRLRQAREQRGLTIRDVANTTKISTAALNAIEHNDFARLPGGLFRRAYVRAFAAEVGLNADEVAREYRSRFEPEILADPPLVGAEGCDDRTRRLRGMVAGAVAAAGILIAGLLLSKPAPITQAPPDEQRILSDLVADASDMNAPIDESGEIEEASSVNASVEEAGDPALRLEIRLTGLCWVSAQADGERVVYRLMQPGERTLVEARRVITLRVGDAGAVAYSINEATGRPLGRDGEVVTVRITNENLGSLSAEPASAIPAKGAATQMGSGSVGRGVAATGQPAVTA